MRRRSHSVNGGLKYKIKSGGFLTSKVAFLFQDIPCYHQAICTPSAKALRSPASCQLTPLFSQPSPSSSGVTPPSFSASLSTPQQNPEAHSLEVPHHACCKHSRNGYEDDKGISAQPPQSVTRVENEETRRILRSGVTRCLVSIY